MKPSTLSRRAGLLGVGVLTAAALSEGTYAFAGTETTPRIGHRPSRQGSA
ncbi:hypothetical protein [Streptomyces sp. NPDC046862]